MTDNQNPSERDAIILEPGLLCDDHVEIAAEWELPLINVLQATQGRCLETDQFYEIAYRLKNGYGPPDGNVPESEQPGVEHINDTLREIQPVCCWLVEMVDNPWPDEPAPAYIGILSDYANRRMSDA